MVKKQMKIEDLAAMIQRGFSETARKIDVEHGFREVSHRFDEVEKRLDRIEKLILADHKRRIERLEMEMKDIRDMFAMK